MFKGFYNLTSGMLTQQRNLNIVGNNLVNLSTSGFKQSRYTASTFDEVMYSRTGTVNKDYEQIGPYSYIRATDQIYVDYSQGVPEPTGVLLDFAIEGEGFFAVRGDDGEMYYTRSGSFSLDNEGYLCYPGQGRVMGVDSQPIQLNTDKIEADNRGRIYDAQGDILGQLGVFRFEDNGELLHTQEGFFTGQQGQLMEMPLVHWQYLERANVDIIQQMTELLTCQRSLQSAAQVAKMYDTMMNRTTNDVGRL